MTPAIFLTVFGCYIASLIVLSTWLARRQRTGQDFLLGNRKVPILLLLGTTVATMVGTGSSMGAIGKAYSDGWAGSLYGLGGAAGILLLARLFADVRRHRFMTFAEEIAWYYAANPLLKAVVGILIILASVGWLGAHILGGSMYVSWITGIDLLWAKLLVAGGFGVFVIIGGYLAVVWTDTIQAIVLFAGFILLTYLSVQAVPPDSGQWLQSARAWSLLEPQNIIPSLSLVYVIFMGVMVTPAFRQRIYSADSVRSVTRSFYWSGTLYLFFSLIPAVVGMAAWQLNPNLDHSNYAFPFLATAVLPTAMGLVVLIAGLSATMSSASSDAIAAVSVLLRDIYILVTGHMPPAAKALLYSRWCTFLIMLLALLFTLYATDIIDYIKYMISLIMSGLFACCMLGRYWQRSTWQGGLASIAAGAICSLIIMMVPQFDHFWGNPALPASATALAAGIAVSLMTPPHTISRDEALEHLTNERELMEQ